LANDWNGADFLAVPIEGDVLKVQLKGRLTFMKKYQNKGLFICFRVDHDWYLYPHDELLNELDGELNFLNTPSWVEGGGYSFPSIPGKVLSILERFKIQDPSQRMDIAS